jgi:hypothetical protein
VGEASKKRVAAIVGVWAVVMGATSFASGCYGHNCDGDVQNFGRESSQGRLLSADLWESNAIDGEWLPFPKQRVWVFDLTTLGNDRLPQLIVPYVSAEPDPLHTPGGNWTIAAGNLAEQSGVANGQVVIKNGTCADYYLRLVVQAAPRPPAATPPPSETPDEAGTDAGNDAGSDAEAGP